MRKAIKFQNVSEKEDFILKLKEDKKQTVILEPQSILNQSVIGYDFESNCLIYCRDHLAKLFCDEVWENENSESVDSLIGAYEWIDYNCNYRVIID
jgi:hypothetical protein